MTDILCASCGAKIALAKDAADTCPKCEGKALLAGKYRLVAIVGRGGNGITYRAERVSDEATVAVKEMPIGTAESTKALELFEREAKVLRQLHHHAIPKYEDDFVFGEGKSTALYLVQEFVRGKTLTDEAKDRRYDTQDVWSIVAELALVLAYLHGRSPPVVHRDVKPQNVMRRDDGSLALIDFGAVRDAVKSTGGSTVAGTFGYMAPEQLAGRATPASDLYALGALACALFARKEADEMLDDEGHLAVKEHTDLDHESLALVGDLIAVSAKERPESAKIVASRAKKLAEREPAEPEPESESAPAAEAAPAREPEPTHQKSKRQLRRERKAQRREEHAAEALAAVAEKENQTKKDDAEESITKSTAFRAWAAIFGFSLAVVAIFLVPTLLSETPTTKKAIESARSTVAPPELYARPLAVDVNGDGTDDVITVVGVDTGPRYSKSRGTDSFGADNGRFLPFVQAIDGKTNKILYALGDYGVPYSAQNAADDKQRIVLAASNGKLMIARIGAKKTDIDIVALASGAPVTKLSAKALVGEGCMSARGVFLAQSADWKTGTLVDLVANTATDGASRPADCRNAIATIADAPTRDVSSRGQPIEYVADATTIAQGTWAGSQARTMDDVAVFAYVPKPKPAETAGAPVPQITVSFTEGEPEQAPRAEAHIIGVDAKSGAVRFDKASSALGITNETIDRVDISPTGVFVLLRGDGGFVVLDPKTGAVTSRLMLPAGNFIAQYTLSGHRAYVHVFGPDNAIYGYLSKKAQSRLLVADLDAKKWIASLPAGPLEPRKPPPAPPPFSRAGYERITGCRCGDVQTGADAAAGKGVELLFRVMRTTESGGHKKFGAVFALAVADDAFPLPYAAAHRDRIVPPANFEGSVPMAIACGDGVAVFALESRATAWSLATKDELWSATLQSPRGETPTTIGGEATLTCAHGSIANGVVHIPAMNGTDIPLAVKDGAPVAPKKK